MISLLMPVAAPIPKDHHRVLYENDNVLIASLADYVSKGFDARETVVIIATPEHVAAPNTELSIRQYDLDAYRHGGQYIVMDAASTLDAFMQHNWPMQDLFVHALAPLLETIQTKGHKIRAFGEMVMLLWKKQLHGATIQLEQLWNDMAGQFDFTLLCAYPVSAFNHGMQSALKHVCKAHATTTTLPANTIMN